jgi:para-nitrobenzyl esterase
MNRFELLGRLDPIMWTKASAAERQTLSRQMGAYWADFARSGDPSASAKAGERSLWRRWAGAAALMRLDGASGGGAAMIGEADSIDRLIADLKAETALAPAQKAIVAETLGLWLPARKDDFAAAAGVNVSGAVSP